MMSTERLSLFLITNNILLLNSGSPLQVVEDVIQLNNGLELKLNNKKVAVGNFPTATCFFKQYYAEIINSPSEQITFVIDFLTSGCIYTLPHSSTVPA